MNFIKNFEYNHIHQARKAFVKKHPSVYCLGSMILVSFPLYATFGGIKQVNRFSESSYKNPFKLAYYYLPLKA